MRVLGLAFAVLLAGTASIVAHANGPGAKVGPAESRPAPGIVLAWDGSGSGGHSGPIGGQRTAGHGRQWNGQWAPPQWGPNRYYGGGALMAGRGSRRTGYTFPVALSLIILSLIGAVLRADGVILSLARVL